MSDNKHPILGRGEFYISYIEKKYPGGPPKYPHTYQENKNNLLNNLLSIKKSISSNSEIFVKEKVLCIRMEPKFEAKSYSPDMIMTMDGIRPIGGRKYAISEKDDIQNKAKLYFAKATDLGIDNLFFTLVQGIKERTKMAKSVNTIRSSIY
jgi:hypothetical protein